MKLAEPALTAGVPMRLVGPVRISGPEMQAEVSLPLATYETPLWPSVNRGAKISTLAPDGLQVVVVSECMSRSVVVEAADAAAAAVLMQAIKARENELAQAAQGPSRFTRWQRMDVQQVANLLYLRFAFNTGDAAGHNMVTAASERALNWLLQAFPALKYVSISANYCTDKKVSAVNGILGRGKYVIAAMSIPRAVCARYLKTTPEKVVELNIKKNLIGTLLAGGLRSANAHYANMLLGFYLATGQDAANIVEGSQGITHAEVREDALYFSVTLPNLIVGTVGNGKELDFVRKNLELLGCLEKRAPGANARRLACIAAAAVWCGELSLMAAQTNPGELMRAHEKYERSH